nr:MAG TPA: hypothetical protein [Caudoviricetes sp.]
MFSDNFTFAIYFYEKVDKNLSSTFISSKSRLIIL